MILKADRIAERLRNESESDDPLVIVPSPNLEELTKSGSGSIDLRLGTWFVTLRQSRAPLLDISKNGKESFGEGHVTRQYYVPFSKQFILHPGYFVLGVTMEWIRFPSNLAGYVVGKSSWGRRGLIIATAVGVHPGFSGCLTLEIANLGEMPISIMPGMQICQLFLHNVDSISKSIDQSDFTGKRRPTLGTIRADQIAERLADSERF